MKFKFCVLKSETINVFVGLQHKRFLFVFDSFSLIKVFATFQSSSLVQDLQHHSLKKIFERVALIKYLKSGGSMALLDCCLQVQTVKYSL